MNGLMTAPTVSKQRERRQGRNLFADRPGVSEWSPVQPPCGVPDKDHAWTVGTTRTTPLGVTITASECVKCGTEVKSVILRNGRRKTLYRKGGRA